MGETQGITHLRQIPLQFRTCEIPQTVCFQNTMIVKDIGYTFLFQKGEKWKKEGMNDESKGPRKIKVQWGELL